MIKNTKNAIVPKTTILAHLFHNLCSLSYSSNGLLQCSHAHRFPLRPNMTWIIIPAMPLVNIVIKSAISPYRTSPLNIAHIHPKVNAPQWNLSRNRSCSLYTEEVVVAGLYVCRAIFCSGFCWGVPHLGHAVARSEIELPQWLHVIIAISFYSTAHRNPTWTLMSYYFP